MLELITRERTPLAASQKAILASLESQDWGDEDWDKANPADDAWGAETDGSADGRKPAAPVDVSLFPKLVSLGVGESLSQGTPSAAGAPHGWGKKLMPGEVGT